MPPAAPMRDTTLAFPFLSFLLQVAARRRIRFSAERRAAAHSRRHSERSLSGPFALPDTLPAC
eukprot:345860-Alexandrium_andersonii.AAC.1